MLPRMILQIILQYTQAGGNALAALQSSQIWSVQSADWQRLRSSILRLACPSYCLCFDGRWSQDAANVKLPKASATNLKLVCPQRAAIRPDCVTAHFALVSGNAHPACKCKCCTRTAGPGRQQCHASTPLTMFGSFVCCMSQLSMLHCTLCLLMLGLMLEQANKAIKAQITSSRTVEIPVLLIILLSGRAGTASVLPIWLEAIQGS